jgi:hypothetical protein
MRVPIYLLGPLSPGQSLDNAINLAAGSTMDEYALELFKLWFNGRAPSVVVLDNPKWAAYMRADRGLREQVDHHLTALAGKIRDDFFLCSAAAKPVVSNHPYRTSFHAIVGGKSGGYRTGYLVLHGSNKKVGDFQMQGVYSMAPTGDSQLKFTFINNELTFNDRVDPNFNWKSDRMFGYIARHIGAAASAPPKDYTVRIRWRDPGPLTYCIPAEPSKPRVKP